MTTETKLSKKALFAMAVVTVNVEKNPKKPGSMSHERFEGYLRLKATGNEFTIQDCIDEGLRADDFRHDEAHGFITLDRVPEATDAE